MRLPKGVGLRAASAIDVPLLHRIYCSTRHDELLVLAWNDVQKAAFLQQQFDLQHHSYHAHFPQAQFCIITCQGEEIGRWYLDRTCGELRLIDIALLPPWRGRGIGSQLLVSLMDDADKCRRHIWLHVAVNNPALAWCARLGFEPRTNDGMYVKLARPPRAAAAVEECR
jgi:ribosomal protein S18 acetylase RimI-like enzyme